jgi:D-alanyl-D-alanine carboxypeptidase (penicillin-binding protein 5/6)
MLIFEKLKKGNFTQKDFFVVSHKAFRLEGTTMHLNLKDHVSVIDLLQGLIIASGNDASVVLAENASGSEVLFCEEMNDYAKKIGTTHTHFINSNGLPDPNHYTTAHDLAIISQHLIKNFPQWLWIFEQSNFSFGKNIYYSKNTLLRKKIGCKGLKTGHCKQSGYGMVGYFIQKKRPILMVINGLNSEKEREKEVSNLVEWAYGTFENFYILKKDEPIIKLPVWYGTQNQIELKANDDIIVSVPSNKKFLKITLEYKTPLKAPIKKGDTLGMITITHPLFSKPMHIELKSSISIAQSTSLKQIFDTFKYMFLEEKMSM